MTYKPRADKRISRSRDLDPFAAARPRCGRFRPTTARARPEPIAAARRDLASFHVAAFWGSTEPRSLVDRMAMNSRPIAVTVILLKRRRRFIRGGRSISMQRRAEAARACIRSVRCPAPGRTPINPNSIRRWTVAQTSHGTASRSSAIGSMLSRPA